MIVRRAVMGLLSLAMKLLLKPEKPVELSDGDLVIERAVDGHFNTIGTVNGQEARFMVHAAPVVANSTIEARCYSATC